MLNTSVATTATVDQPSRVTPSARLTSLDAFRGATMLFMASEIMGIPGLARDFPDSSTARVLANLLDHRAWVGCAPWDLIQPAFMFMVGVALPFSIASRRAKGQSTGRMFAHTVYRGVMLIALGIFLRSQSRAQTYFTFEDVLTQIGLGYVFLFLLGWVKPRAQWAAAIVILVGYWAAFALYPLPAPGFDTTSVGVPADWPDHQTGFAQHWDKNTNLASDVDRWFLNLFPRERPFAFNRGGYLTLNFVPSLATMIFGLLAGGLLRSERPGLAKVRLLIIYGLAGIAIGWLAHATGICPLVKRIWTPSWTLFSAGWVALMLAACYYVIDLRGYRRWAWPLLVVGANSIAIYVLVHVATDYVTRSFRIHLGSIVGAIPPPFQPVALGAGALLVFWLILAWMYRNRVFVRI
ncbi:MAG: acyltransferase family protein [Vicinamibacterales bacterium]